jgi:3-oxoacyl-[acyl-carrier protein] reductase
MNQTVLITGASRGIGKSIALEFAKSGFNLVLTCRSNRNLIEEVASVARGYNISCYNFIGDLSNEDIVVQLFSELQKNDIKINILVNNAGISYFGLIQDMTLSEWNNIINTNLTTAFLLSRAVIPNMVHNQKGKIINISSVWGIVGSSFETAYSASKGALNSFTKALAKELAPSNIQVNAIACGVIDTQMNAHLSREEMSQLEDSIPAGRMGKPSEVADLVLKLAISSDYLTGQIIALDGGWI